MKDLTIRFSELKRKDHVQRWIDFLSGVFELTPKEVTIMNEFIIILVEMIEKGISNEDSKFLMYVKKDEIKEKLNLNQSAFNKHLRNLGKKEAIIVGENFILVHNYLIPKNSIKIEFNG